MSGDELIYNQLKKFNKILQHASRYTKFYKNLYAKHGLIGLQVKYQDDVAKIPIVSKKDFRAVSHDDLLSKTPEGGYNNHYTSGSTGEPFLVKTSKQAEYTAHIRIFLTLIKYGYKPYHQMTIVSRYESGTVFQVEKDIRLYSALNKYLPLFKRCIISIYDLPAEIIRKIRENKPYVLVSTPGVLSVIIQYLKKQNIKLRIPIVFLTSETVTSSLYADVKEYIGDTLIDMYGCMECPSIGFEINNCGIREIFTNTCYFEVVQDECVRDFTGKAVLTNLLNFTQPVIRYSLNDLVQMPAQEKYPNKRIGKILGRLDDVVTFHDGSILAHHHAHEMFMDFKECQQFKFIQKGRDISLLLVLQPNTDKRFVITKAGDIWKHRYPNVNLDIKVVETILPDALTGKVKNLEIIRQ